MKQLALCLLCVCGPVYATEIPLLPPVEYDHPFPGHTEITIVQGNNVQRQCGGPANVAGCAWLTEGVCSIVVAMYSPRALMGDIIRHEIAHCNGWEH